MSRKHRKHTHIEANRMITDADRQFRAFVEAHNAAIECAAEEEPESDAEDFAEMFLIKMRRALAAPE